ncbi:MAG: NAD(P)H-hydrate dehydratase [Lysobacteraceae bacterium]
MSAALDLHTAAAARAIDRHAIDALGIAGTVLMERAGAAAFVLLRERWPQARRIGVACGTGNNGGDGYVLARLARQAGLDPVLLATGDPGAGEARAAAAAWASAGGACTAAEAALDSGLPAVDVWVDALLGIGLSRPPDDGLARLIQAIGRSGRPVLALDVPSGVDADSGHAPGAALQADATISFITAKRGLFSGRGRLLSGRRHLDRLDVPGDAFAGHPPAAVAMGRRALVDALPARAAGSHKGDHGRVLCVGGDSGLGGAIALCAEAALRSGAGLVSVATRPAHVAAVLARRPEVMARGVEDGEALEAALQAADVLALGPGLGRSEWSRALWRAALATGLPVVLDADALNLLAESAQALPASCVLTPHPGEAARLLYDSVAAVESDRFGAAAALASRYSATVVLKGPGTLVASEGRATRVIDAGNPGMATGGMGDVLTGVVASLLAQGHAPFEAGWVGALLHAAAADRAAGTAPRGLLPSDLMAPLRTLANPEAG